MMPAAPGSHPSWLPTHPLVNRALVGMVWAETWQRAAVVGEDANGEMILGLQCEIVTWPADRDGVEWEP